MFSPGPGEIAVIGVIAVLMFGKNLPEVAKKLGKSYKQFRKGLADMQAQINLDDDGPSSSSPSYYSNDYDDYEAPTAPKFDPPTSEPATDSESSAKPEEV